MRVRARVLFPAVLAAACSEPPSEPACSGVEVQQIFAGAASDGYLGLSPAEQNAFVSVLFDGVGAELGTPCSGALIAPDWVLTARHCVPHPDSAGATVSIGEQRHEPEATFRGARWEAAPTPGLDAVLLQLHTPVPAELAVPLGVSSLPSESLLGARVLMGGYGRNEDDTAGFRRFVTESVVNTGGELLTVDGRGLSGACSGDSGGPAVWRDGRAVVIGVLKQGDTSCRALDHYVDIAALRPWLLDVVGPPPSAPPACGELTHEGACFTSTGLAQAVWCEAGTLRALRCEAPAACGWDAHQGGFRCVEPANDACDGVSQLGVCDGRSVVRCLSGEPVREACPQCRNCDVDPRTGTATCLDLVIEAERLTSD